MNQSGDNNYETEVYDCSADRVVGGDLAITARYHKDVAPAGGAQVQRNFVSGLVSTPTGKAGYTGFTWTPGGGETWAFEIDTRSPPDDLDLFNAFWSSSQAGWTDERDFIEGRQSTGVIDTDWIYDTGQYAGLPYSHNIYISPPSLGFDPAAAFHRYTYVVHPDQSWSLYIDGVLQRWVGDNGTAPPQKSDDVPMDLLLDYALSATHTTSTRTWLVKSVAVYEDRAHAGQGISGQVVAPGTSVP